MPSQESRITALEQRCTALEAGMAAANTRIAALEVRASATDQAIAALTLRQDDLETALTSLEGRVTVLEGNDPPDPPPGRTLLGGWRLTQEFARGALAIDFATMRCWLGGHSQRAEVVEYQLPAMGTGTDPSQWPAVTGSIVPGWWGASEYANGLCWWQGKLWAAPRNGYDTNPPASTTLFAQDGQTLTIPLPRQRFSGFVKRGPGLEPLLGCGGYESGQGSCSGPTLGTLQGQALISWEWPSDPADWNGRSPREPNYWPKDHVDSWVAWEPRTVNGVLEGRWASDCVYGGGLVLPEGVCYWPWMGTGELDYARQRPTFAADGMERAYRYCYDAQTHVLLGWEEEGTLAVGGQELDAQGRVYLCKTNAWTAGAYRVDPAIYVYG